MKFTTSSILQAMNGTGMIPVFNHTDISVAKGVLEASYKAGIRVFEFTNRTENSLQIFQELVQYAEKYPDLIMGIGTIFTVEDAVAYTEAGAQFIVSPALIPELAVHCNSQNIFWIPGCATMSEIYAAKKLGATLVKAFPGNVVGSAFVAAAKSVYPDLNIMPTGGVEPSEANLSEWFRAGVFCVGMGSQLFNKEWIKNQQFDLLENKIADTLKIIAKL
ncbi:bifunctional 4-hydroxy-2-oxoglutarate aldolase/2-dehydro-3-deoxy-phosphogluconate aldolase [Algoriphagus halophytocola]|uniref:Bifunctional 4-hydroxy-2-oxoglutarate aldolase/2-dehydro-3-deoxy-phosphogluconate aldolase n=1 Tax=Algoriphagus halophytocola TaxID=2991499 RepID=A0ABY6MCZ6_9BACT|nr:MULTISPECIES: bifunctional 4-hydroxy-2-oxoglutarate aldolase/2-dehydro-3-deoxy-phosphogluconate aldolase [unclassified Algoriphagus]UZD21214.1 bifunctional 4-hydroxy-2-oxoglutarate aldolase/2-dehydro-3-deoxy-phosphogluconate aldolase [Algoriphagus sp. TR-M5]WBL42425.1 bifunctional 4-hydroxy-2-oxoglutarate aldolase/2-dehydro-3-deoxy-phosphogluconate aldolase [Algoriphagus sp. TR-M9]